MEMDLKKFSLDKLLEIKFKYENFHKYLDSVGDKETAMALTGAYWGIVNEIRERERMNSFKEESRC